MKKERSSRSEVRNLMTMLGSSIIFAFVVVVGLVYYFGSSGTYLLKNVLISPKAMERISFTDYNPSTGKRAPFVFNKIEFVISDSSGKGWGRYAVSRQSYAEFYDGIDNLRSIPKLTDEIVYQFDIIYPSTLTISVFARDNLGTLKEGTLFQQVQFLDQDDVFRVQLRREPSGETPKEEWVYFRSPGIYKKAVQTFAPAYRRTHL